MYLDSESDLYPSLISILCYLVSNYGCTIPVFYHLLVVLACDGVRVRVSALVRVSL